MSDDWDFYFCQVENRPASIFVDLGIHRELPILDLVDMAWLRLHLRQPRKDGLSSQEESGRLSEIEDALSQALANAEIKTTYVGRNTSDGCRDFFCYASDGAQAENYLSMAMAPFPEYEFEVGSRSDPEWSVYREFLYPSRRAYQTILNRRVLANLEQHGDLHDIVREVSHWMYFESSDERERFLAAVLQRGFRLVAQHDGAEEERPFGLTVSRSHAVDLGTINDVVLELFDLASQYAGDYDGWETSVEKGGE